MDKNYEEIYEEMDFLEHPLTKKNYKSIAIDSTSIQIQRPTDHNIQKLYFQSKKKIHCAKFHVEVSTKTKRLLYVSKLYKGATNDKKIGDLEYQILDQNGIQKVDENGNLMYKHSTIPVIGKYLYINIFIYF
ncbi:hypothetical protein DICPUDRAFT_30982 [Dictyostelium purpureum]|uniref:DDE Tnp4 domain-containing protein n=1 Tax=Dictyostelium purpureum TaxID=5786 RepID=F0ZGC9_DICPU|nr:uncharacterized protein DICPUDRAFT_30982 [Dictyostelium purpureum]EGC36988.1 hypothetical protein DICPUDRAFT_30982 [Dictyostelium purpureum]|eukprot:XP_003286485.1 hypothetical protein DICPUDRAFT_30982 [Dictyostelium purpureum]